MSFFRPRPEPSRNVSSTSTTTTASSSSSSPYAPHTPLDAAFELQPALADSTPKVGWTTRFPPSPTSPSASLPVPPRGMSVSPSGGRGSLGHGYGGNGSYRGDRDNGSAASSPLGSPMMPALASPRSPAPSTRSIRSGSGQPVRGVMDGEERVAYEYALRVAALHQHLLHPPHPPSPAHNIPPTSPSPPTSPAPLPRRKSFAFLRSSSSNAAPGGDPPKLPKEFLVEFWQSLSGAPAPPALGAEGEAAWGAARGAFLRGIKKGSRSESGGNLREVGVLLETFTSFLPATASVLASQYKYQTHLLSLLSAALPRSSVFSPMARELSDKDRKLLVDLKAEILAYSLPDGKRASGAGLAVPPVPALPPVPPMPGSAGMGRASLSSPGDSPRRESTAHGVRRKAAPSAVGLGLGEGAGMVEIVGLVFCVRQDEVQRDLGEILAAGDIEEMYMYDLLSALHSLRGLPSPTASQRLRADHVRAELNNLHTLFPHLVQPPGGAFGAPFFSPPNRARTLSVLAARAADNLALRQQATGLVQRCREVWGVPTLREREGEVEALVARWCRVVSTSVAAHDRQRTQEEAELGRELVSGVDDLVALSDDGHLPRVLHELGATCVKLLGRISGDVWSGRSTGPPVSLLPILRASGGVLVKMPEQARAMSDVADELRAAAVGEYVRVAGEVMSGAGHSAPGAKAYEKVGRWIEEHVQGAEQVWGRGLGEGSAFDPASLVLSKQLPLFFAELHMLDTAGARRAAEDALPLYAVVVRLAGMWEELCEGQDHGFEPHAFFEPLVREWIDEVGESRVQVWVSRAVGMDDWTLVAGDEHGVEKRSQSVDDLFESLRQAVETVRRGVPVPPQHRAGLLADIIKAVALAVKQYAGTVQALYEAEVCPERNKAQQPSHADAPNAKLNDRLAGKASGWLNKGQQAVKGLERKKVEGFVLPRTACVKMADMGAARRALRALADDLEREEEGHAPRVRATGPATFNVTVVSGEGMHTKQGKAAEGFVVVTERESGERLLKTRTVPGEDARWNESFEMTTPRLRSLDMKLYDRSLVGKHDALGTASVHLDPKAPAGARAVLVPLAPRGLLRLVLASDGGEQREARHHLDVALAVLARAEERMADECVERVMELVREQLSARVLGEMARSKAGKKGQGQGQGQARLTEQEVQMGLEEVFGMLNANFSTFSTYLAPATRESLMLALWTRLMQHLISLLVPPLSELVYTARTALPGPVEVDIVFKWLNLLKLFFNAKEDDGVEYGLPMVELQGGRYRDLVMLGQYLDLPGPALRERIGATVRAVRGAQGQGQGQGQGARGVGMEEGLMHGMRGLSVVPGEGERMAEVLLRIARTRTDMGEFLPQQVALYNRLRVEGSAA